MEHIFNGSEKIGEIISNFPGASNLFKEHNIDFCCGGNRALLTVLRQQNLNEQQFIERLNQIYLGADKNNNRNTDWRNAKAVDLIEHVINTHHVFLKKELPLLSEFVTKILRVHGPTHGEVLLKLYRFFHQMKMELEQHMITEEEVVFPLIKQFEENRSPILLYKILKTIDELEADHSSVGNLLKEMRAITSSYKLPADACRTYTLTFQKLEELESDLFQHIHLENNILFPRITERRDTMVSESNQDRLPPVTCDECGKINGQGQVGTHWICEDCKIDVEDKPIINHMIQEGRKQK